MTEKEFRKLSRAQYLEMMVEQGREIKRLKEDLELVQQKLAAKELKIADAGSIAEAALSINEVFESAQRAADQYLENIKARSTDAGGMTAESELAATEARCRQMLKEAEARCKHMEEETEKRCRAMLDSQAKRFRAKEKNLTEEPTKD
jgi:predicted component of type VI protein secretion system